MTMRKFRAKVLPFTLLQKGETDCSPYAYFRCKDGDKAMYCVSPLHGRSFVVGKEKGRYIISKGNGLSFTEYPLLKTEPKNCDSWGLLLTQDAERDFILGEEVESLGIKTNHMEYVMSLDMPLKTGTKTSLLQYSVECPYRICDAPFMRKEDIENEIVKWKRNDTKGHGLYHMIAADILVRNLRVLHTHNVLHNAIHTQNYTWALELLDFELACSPLNPYSDADDQRHVKDLFPREIMQTYEIVNFIAWALGEPADYRRIDNVFKDYGFDLERFRLL